MATIPWNLKAAEKDDSASYPTSDGRPMGETDLHRKAMIKAIETLEMFYAGKQVYVSGNILLFYRPGDRRKHVSPDLLVVKGLEPHNRENYLLWKEGKSPDMVLEVTSKSTRAEDQEEKYAIYRDVLGVREYFLFDPLGEYLDPQLQGHRLSAGAYQPIEPVNGRLPSEELGLGLEQAGSELRFCNSRTGKWLPTLEEARKEAEAARKEAEAASKAAEAENAKLRREIEALRKRGRK